MSNSQVTTKLYIAETRQRFEHGISVVRAESKEHALELLKQTEQRWLYELDDIDEYPLDGPAEVHVPRHLAPHLRPLRRGRDALRVGQGCGGATGEGAGRRRGAEGMSKRDVYFMLLPAYEGDSNARVEGPFTRGEIGAEIARLAKDYDGLRFVERVLDEDDNDVDSDEYTVAIIRGSFVVPKPVDVVKTWKVDE